MIEASPILGIAIGIGLVAMTKKESMTDRLGVLILLAAGIGLRFGPFGDKVREGTANIAKWVDAQDWDAVGPDAVALVPAALAVVAMLIVWGAFWHGNAEALAVAAAVLLPTLLTSVGSGSILDLLGQVFSAMFDLLSTLVEWTTEDLAEGISR